MRTFAIATTLFFASIAAIPAAAGEYLKGEVSDMALIYQGGTHRPDWTEDELKPYVVHTYADGHTSWFFDAFLFLEFETQRPGGLGFANSYGNGPASRPEWEWLLDRMFAEDKALDALDKLIGKMKVELGDPGFKHKVVISTAVPCENQTNWGKVDGQKLNFMIRSHQIIAAKWYIGQIVERFKAADYKNIELVGIYWLDETIAKAGDLCTYVAEYVHELGLKFYWIPYWASKGATEWKELGFDYAYIQPNHFFNTSILDNRITDATRFAKKNGMGLEMEWDADVLYENVNSKYSRLEAYIDRFESDGVFAESSIAYYSGTKAILQMYRSSHIENTLILDRIAKHIEERHKAMTGGVDNVTSGGGGRLPIAIAGEGEVYVPEDAGIVDFYGIDGRRVFSGSGLLSCVKGMYIATDHNGSSQKLFVR